MAGVIPLVPSLHPTIEGGLTEFMLKKRNQTDYEMSGSSVSTSMEERFFSREGISI